jgi:hypothetical protein
MTTTLQKRVEEGKFAVFAYRSKGNLGVRLGLLQKNKWGQSRISNVGKIDSDPIFDEATSNLDDETANAFGETINQLRGRATILMIAHKLPQRIAAVETFKFDKGASR